MSPLIHFPEILYKTISSLILYKIFRKKTKNLENISYRMTGGKNINDIPINTSNRIARSPLIDERLS